MKRGPRGSRPTPTRAGCGTSTVFEDAADWIVGCAHADGSTLTTITSGEKTRREIPTETLIIDLDVGGHGTPSTGGGDDPFKISTPVNPLDATISGYLMAHPEGSTQNAVQKAVGGRRPRLVSRLKVVGTLGTDKLWRCATQPGAEAKQSQKYRVRLRTTILRHQNRCVPMSKQGGGKSGRSGVCPGESGQWDAGWDAPCTHVPPYRGRTSGTHVRDAPRDSLRGGGSLGPCSGENDPPSLSTGGG